MKKWNKDQVVYKTDKNLDDDALSKFLQIGNCLCIGFALPKLNCIEFVVEVAVCYKEWKYTCEIDHLKQDDIASRIKKALKHNLDFLSEPIRTKVDKFDGKVPSITPNMFLFGL